ncbi:MAG: efflux RND transporter periplasmic adaptor subunit [Peptococcaceae bacterium]|nr:efflux RND transporter periplasmic adaptor subunit [Peptococcaceae bacterium]
MVPKGAKSLATGTRRRRRAGELKKRIILWVAGILVVAIIAAGVAAKMRGEKTAASAAGGTMAINVQTAPATLGDISSVNSLTGNVSANQTATVGTEVSGRVRSVSADVGQAVSTGTVLAQLDPINIQNQLAEVQAQEAGARAALVKARADYQRNSQLYISGAVAKATLDQYRLVQEQAQSQLDYYQAQIASLRQQIREMTITSPVDGVVATKTVEIGQEVSTQSVLFTVVQIDPVRVTVDVPDQLIAEIRPGVAARVKVPELGNGVFQGTVLHVSPVLDTVSHGYPVEIQVNNPGSSMLPGMTATVVFTGLQRNPGIIIPVQAVLETAQGSEVFTVSGGVAHLHVIQLGAVSSNLAVVESGLKKGDRVVINGEDLLSDGSRVNVVPSAAQAGVQGMINRIKQGAGR